MKGVTANLKWDMAYLTNNGKTLALDLVNLTINETDLHFDEPVVLAETNTDRTEDVKSSSQIVKFGRQERFDNRKIKGLIIVPTWACSARCTYCYVAKVREDTVMLTADKVNDAIKKYNINPDDVEGTIYIGGDPMENLKGVEDCINIFPNAHHTICTGFVGDDSKLEQLLSIVMFNSNVEISLSIDPPESGRYKFDVTHERNLAWLATFKKLIGKRIRIKSTLNAQAYKISELRKTLPTDTHISFDGAAYGFGKMKNVEQTTIDGIKEEFDLELERIQHLDYPNESFFSFLQSAGEMLEGTLQGQSCSCGMEYFTLLPSGELSYCDSPERPILDENLDNEEMSLSMETKTPCGGGGICNSCIYQKFCGGSCGVTKQHELYCYVKVLDFVYSTYIHVFGVLNENT
jgi:sulfatase maturation enzyme AslB (radical SAM superfamily)